MQPDAKVRTLMPIIAVVLEKQLLQAHLREEVAVHQEEAPVVQNEEVLSFITRQALVVKKRQRVVQLMQIVPQPNVFQMTVVSLVLAKAVVQYGQEVKIRGIVVIRPMFAIRMDCPTAICPALFMKENKFQRI